MKGPMTTHLNPDSERADRLLEQVLRLSVDQRARVAERVLASLEEVPREPTPDVEQAWAREVAARIKSLEDGTAKTVSAEEALGRARARLEQARSAKRGS